MTIWQHNRALESGADFLKGGPKQLYVNGEYSPAASGKTYWVTNPTTGQPLAEIADGNEVDVDRAVSAARAAFEGAWARVKPQGRQQLLLKIADLVEKHYDELAALDTLNMGAPLTRTRAMRGRALSLLRFYAGLATMPHGATIANSVPGNVLSYTVKEPVGVVGAITPWNGPLTLGIWKIAPALAAGCTVVLKPSEQTPLSSLRLAEICAEAGLPPGVLNVITGQGVVGAALSAHRGVNKITFTGSTDVGQRIIAASAGNVKRLSLELGGKSPNIVFADADLDLAVPAAAMAVFSNSGQVCSAGTRLFVQRQVYDEFVDRVAAYGSKLVVGDPADPATDLGPLVSERHLSKVVSYLDIGHAEGARALCGGERCTTEPFDEGYFVRPTVFADVTDEMRIAREEIFGPVISALPFDDIDEVLRRANDSDLGLGSGVWTKSLKTAHKMSQGLRAGSVWVNCYQAMDAAVPFGGYKMSGYGRESGVEHIEEFLETKAVWLNID
ncbi:aldehyde dehydrogenase [Variovorax sp. dw_308]|uniref:aldehyde dehydrogenase family protein n=1 Tax=Variovorax sp. dw_308 TaxID=2721546 RepID=UPI001C44AC33|nr:aldehyde dehydrogenase family protein [Variovorax sp. dw_308]